MSQPNHSVCRATVLALTALLAACAEEQSFVTDTGRTPDAIADAGRDAVAPPDVRADTGAATDVREAAVDAPTDIATDAATDVVDVRTTDVPATDTPAVDAPAVDVPAADVRPDAVPLDVPPVDGGSCSFPPDFMNSSVCSSASTYAAMCSTGVELHILGVYEPMPRGATINVTVSRTRRPIALVLSSYEPATWNLMLAAGVTLNRVILNGYNTHTVLGAPAGVPVDNRSGVGRYLTACAFQWPSDTGGCDTPGLVSMSSTMVGVPVTSFTGCYASSSFTLTDR